MDPELKSAVPKVPSASSIAVRNVMKANRGQDTRPEIALRSALHRRGLRFRKHVAPLEGLRCIADVVFPRQRVAVFVDGCFWHGCPIHGSRPQTNRSYWAAKIARNIRRDANSTAELRKAGWAVLRIWEHEPPEVAAETVEAVVRAREHSIV